MAISKIKLFCNSVRLEAFSCSGIVRRKAQLRSFASSSRYCSSEKSSSTEDNVRSNLQKIPKKNRTLSVIDEKDRELIETLKAGTDPNYPYDGSYEKVSTLLKEGFKELGKRTFKRMTGVELNIKQRPFYPQETDILIIGCTPVGLSVAFAMKERFRDTPNIIVVDRNEKFPHASTNLGQSVLMQQLYVDEEEIAMNRYAAEFLQAFPRLTEVDEQPRFTPSYEPLGSLLLADEENAESLLKKVKTLKSHGVNNKILDNKALKERFPWLKLDDVLFGSLGMEKEGVYDPWTFLNGLKCKAVNMGVEFLTAEVIDIGFENKSPRRVICRMPDGFYHPIKVSIVVLACGMESLNFLDIINSADVGPITIDLPLEERMRYEFCFRSPKGPGLDTPIVVDSDGTYFRREGLCNYYVAGVPCVKPTENDIEPYEVFINKVKPFLTKRVPQFDQIDLIKGWIDSYDFCVTNETGIIGPHPYDHRIFFALGFSHMGLQHAPAVGRAIMEFIAYCDYRTIPMQRYHIENLWEKPRAKIKEKEEKLLESKERVALTE